MASYNHSKVGVKTWKTWKKKMRKPLILLRFHAYTFSTATFFGWSGHKSIFKVWNVEIAKSRLYQWFLAKWFPQVPRGKRGKKLRIGVM